MSQMCVILRGRDKTTSMIWQKYNRKLLCACDRSIEGVTSSERRAGSRISATHCRLRTTELKSSVKPAAKLSRKQRRASLKSERWSWGQLRCKTCANPDRLLPISTPVFFARILTIFNARSTSPYFARSLTFSPQNAFNLCSWYHVISILTRVIREALEERGIPCAVVQV